LFVTLIVMPGLVPGIQSRKPQVWKTGHDGGANGSFSSRLGIIRVKEEHPGEAGWRRGGVFREEKFSRKSAGHPKYISETDTATSRFA
jgi:hypothetical protein